MLWYFSVLYMGWLLLLFFKLLFSFIIFCYVNSWIIHISIHFYYYFACVYKYFQLLVSDLAECGDLW